MGKPLVAKKEIILKYNVKIIWNIVLNNNDYKWRTDIKEIKILENGKDWIEYYDMNRKYFTRFILREKEEYNLYSFDMENKNFYGNWVGKFFEINNNETKCIFIETIYIKNRIMNIVAKIFLTFEKIQEQYFKDLGKKLLENK
ncbi:hypothetical protein [Treponema primitia]|uniref:hypothetical protein n=1 Tax=Treponema primitia TaxID=88058 RepID=UPI00025555F3|nr:hypothetical protein [Treponema primitia]